MEVTKAEVMKGEKKKEGDTETPETLEEIIKKQKKELSDQPKSVARSPDSEEEGERGMLSQDMRGRVAFDRALQDAADCKIIHEHADAVGRVYEHFEFADMAGFSRCCSMLQEAGVPDDRVRKLGEVLGKRKYGEKQMGKIMQGGPGSGVKGHKTPKSKGPYPGMDDMRANAMAKRKYGMRWDDLGSKEMDEIESEDKKAWERGE